MGSEVLRFRQAAAASGGAVLTTKMVALTERRDA